MKSEGIIQFFKFCVVGVINTAVDWIVYFLLVNSFLSPDNLRPTAKAISFLAAVINSYLLNTIWTFKKEYQRIVGKPNAASLKRGIFIKFFVVSLVGWLVNYLVFKYAFANLEPRTIMILSRSISMKDIYPLVLASAAAILWNFFANKLWTYKK